MCRFWFRFAPAVALAGLLVTFAVGEDPPVRIPVKRPPPRGPVGTTLATETPVSDEEALKAADLTAQDGPRLIEYLKLRTLSDVDQGKITGIIKRFGADDFDERVKATEEIERFGPAAVGPLKAAERDGDPEIAFRAKMALKKMAKVPHSAVASATVRAVVKLKPAGAAGALIGFLPLADDETVGEAIREALVALAVRDGKAEPALVSALNDASPLRRSAAYVALITGGPANERIRIKDVYPMVREAVLKEPDPEARFTGLWSLLLTTREKEYVPALIGLIPNVGRGRIWQLEDFLIQLAGSHPKDGRFLKAPESLTRSRDAWLGWWKENGDRIDLVKLAFKPRLLGITDVIEMDNRGYGQGRVVSLGPDLKEKWRITGVNNATDVKVAENGTIYVVESNISQITERTASGTIITKRNVYQQPMNVDLLPDGGMVVICRNNVTELDKDGKVLHTPFLRPNFDVMTGHRFPNGDVLFITNAFQGGPNCFRLDSKLKDTGKSYTLGRVQNLQTMDVIGDDRVLVCEFDKVAEYDLKTGTAKQTWKHDCQSPSSCQRLPNGNTLITLLNQNQVIEVDPSGEIVWDYQAKDGLRVGRARRR